MNKHVILSIRGQQVMQNHEPDVIELITEGTLASHGNEEFTLRYQESELTGLEGTQTTLQIGKDKVTLLREGQVNSQMVFEAGQRHCTMYDTPYGALAVGITTRRMKVSLGEGGGDIEIAYAIELDHALAGENLFQISIKERGARSIPQ